MTSDSRTEIIDPDVFLKSPENFRSSNPSGLRHEYDKLITTVSPHDIRFPEGFFDDRTECLYGLVAFLMTECIIDQFQIIHVGKQKSSMPLTAHQCFNALPDKGNKPSSVIQ